jgi:outer membrane protein
MKKCSVTLIALVMAATAPATVAFEKSDMIVRVGVSTVSPDDPSSNILVGSDLGFNVKVDDNTQLGLNFAYF